MTLAYLPRLVCISLAAYFLIHMAFGMIVSLIARPVLRAWNHTRPEVTARRLLGLRLLPALGSGLTVLFVCLPSYLWLEPEGLTERVGYGCLAAALLGLVMWGFSIARGVRAVAASRRFLDRCRRSGRPGRLANENVETWIVADAAPLLALGGIFRPRLLASRGLLDALQPDQLAAALRHERAHWISRDNLKRLCILLAPAVLPVGPGNRTIESGWRTFTEWAADDRAVDGSRRRSFALAAALVCVARMHTVAPESPLALPLFAERGQLAARVDRLLGLPPVDTGSADRRPVLGLSVLAVTAASVVVAFFQPAALYAVHLALERLVD